MLVKADLSNAEELLPIQQRAFAALYEIYQDQYNPAIETMDYFQSRFARPNCNYYKIVEEGHTVGLVQTTVAEDTDQGWLGLIGIDPDHRGKGYGHKAIKTEPEQEGMDMVYMEKWKGQEVRNARNIQSKIRMDL